MQSFILVFVGSGIGGVCRFGISKLMSGSSTNFPYATLGINMIGSFLLGLVLAQTIDGKNESLRWLLAIGFCGGFTTFSTFSMEALQLLKGQNISAGLIYVLLSVVLSVVGAWIGFSKFSG